jgi:thioredoxin-related protein
LPLFQKAIEKYESDSDVAFLAVSTDADREFVEPYLRQNKHKLPVVFAENIDGFFNVSAIPTTIILDRRGKVSFRMRGFNPNEDFTAQLSGWIEAAKKK